MLHNLIYHYLSRFNTLVPTKCQQSANKAPTMKLKINKQNIRGEDKWVLTVWVDGKRKRKFFDTYADANTYDVVGWIGSTFDAGQPGMRVTDGLTRYLEEYSQIRASLVEDHEIMYRRLHGQIKDHPPFKALGKSLRDLEGGDFTSLVAMRKRSGLSASSINKELYFCSGAFKFLADNYKVEIPHINWKSIRLETFKKKRWATVEQLKLILANIDCELQRDVCLALILTGARLSEVLELRWTQVDLDEGFIYLHRTKVDNEGMLPISDDLAAVLTRRRKEKSSNFVFPSPIYRNRHLVRPRAIDRAIKVVGLNDDPDLVKAKGKFTIHSLRDSYASILAQSGEHDLNEIREMLGHSSTVMTNKYAHLIPRDVAKRVKDTLDGRF